MTGLQIVLWLGGRDFLWTMQKNLQRPFPTPLQNDSAGEAVDSKCITFISQSSQSGIEAALTHFPNTGAW